ncbi:unnamed protein product [Brachionus calyciflorus]|uniref:BROMI C-terminal Rab TBC-like domain-containing protein n=1 Tax=Brachionus calyciflorus TaxID=104777 RepID=A0A814MK64_9BILA|nr:unnamed protein product [Brachionus calyciflorus]
MSQIQKLGIDKTIQYGTQINQLVRSTKEENKNKLTELHKFIKNLLKISNSNSKKSSVKQESYLAYCQEEFYPGYDWFTSTIFLMNKGDLNSSMNFLYNFHFLQISSLLWSARLFSNNFLISNVYTKNGINILLPTTCHYIELILKIELPLIFSAFRMSGLSPSLICSNWLKQCFWNYLDWPEIVTYTSLCIIFGIDFQTYFCVSILKHLNEKQTDNPMYNNQSIIQHHTDRDLQIFLKEGQIENFKIENYIDFMFSLEKKYRKYILEDIKQILS